MGIFRKQGKDNEYTVFLDERRQAVEAAKDKVKEEKKKEKKDEVKKRKANQNRCTKMKSDGFRCSMMVNKPKTRCHFHD